MSKFDIHFTYEDIVNAISNELQEFKKTFDINSLKTDPHLIRIVSNTADAYITNHNKINKHNLILDVIIKLFDITHEEKEIILHKINIVLNHKEEPKNKTMIDHIFEWLNYICCFFS